MPRKKIVLLKKVVNFYMCAHELLPPRPKQLDDIVASNLFGRHFPLCDAKNYPRVSSSSHAKYMAFPPYGAHGVNDPTMNSTRDVLFLLF